MTCTLLAIALLVEILFGILLWWGFIGGPRRDARRAIRQARVEIEAGVVKKNLNPPPTGPRPPPPRSQIPSRRL